MLVDILARRWGATAWVGLLLLIVLSVFSLGWVAFTFSEGAYLGGDFRSLYASGWLVLKGQASEMYDLDSQRDVQSALMEQEEAGADTRVYPMLYLAAFALVFAPFAGLPPEVSYYTWFGFSAAAFVAGLFWLGRSLGIDIWPLLLLALGFYPFIQGLVEGQTHALMFLGTVGFYVSLRVGDSRSAGLWLSSWLLKPQLLVLPVLLLLWKRQREILLPFAMSALAVVGFSIALVGIDGAREYLALLLGLSGTETAVANSPQGMINWRALAIHVFGFGRPDLALASVVVPSLATALLALLPWRGRAWRTVAQPEMDVLLLCLTSATLLTAFHSHKHGFVLILPALIGGLAAAKAGASTSLAVRWLFDLLGLGPSVAVVLWGLFLAPLGVAPTFSNIAMLVILAVTAVYVAGGFLLKGSPSTTAVALEGGR